MSLQKMINTSGIFITLNYYQDEKKISYNNRCFRPYGF